MSKLDVESIVAAFIGVACIYMPNQLSRILEILHESLQDHEIELASIEHILVKIRSLSCHYDCLGDAAQSNIDTRHHSYPKQRYSVDLKLECVELYLTGLVTQQDIASEKGVSTKSIQRWVKQYKQDMFC